MKGGKRTAEEGKGSRRHQRAYCCLCTPCLFALSCCVAPTKRGEDGVKEVRWWMATCERSYFMLQIFLPCKVHKMLLSAHRPYWHSSVVAGCIFIVSSASRAKCQEVDLALNLP